MNEPVIISDEERMEFAIKLSQRLPYTADVVYSVLKSSENASVDWREYDLLNNPEKFVTISLAPLIKNLSNAIGTDQLLERLEGKMSELDKPELSNFAKSLPITLPKHYLKITYEIEPAEKPGEVYVTPIQHLDGKRLEGEGVRYGPMAKSLIPAFKIQTEKLYRTTMRKWLDLKKMEARQR